MDLVDVRCAMHGNDVRGPGWIGRTGICPD